MAKIALLVLLKFRLLNGEFEGKFFVQYIWPKLVTWEIEKNVLLFVFSVSLGSSKNDKTT